MTTTQRGEKNRQEEKPPPGWVADIRTSAQLADALHQRVIPETKVHFETVCLNGILGHLCDVMAE